MVSTSLGLIAVGPVLLALVGQLPGPGSGAALTVRLAAARLASAGTLLIALATAGRVFAYGPLRTGLIGSHGVGVSLYVDALSATMFCLVAFIGAIVVRFSGHYLAGDPGHARFIRWLCSTLAAVLFVILAGNLLFFAVAWLLTSMALHRLLVFYPQRQAAILAARKKFIASRLGDLCLLGVLVLLYQTFGSLDYADIFRGAGQLHAVIPLRVHAAALLLAITAMLKSAQFPLHGWLIEVMETPTPVSALLHAGIINAGGFLVLRFADIISLSTPTLYTLAFAGGFTALFGSIVMLPQTSVKVSLAYSTVAQMGFMMLECGLGAFSTAWLHIIAHSLYKAHAFLASGSVIDLARASWTPSPGGQPHPARMAIAIVVVLLVTAAVGAAFGTTITQKPGAFTLGAVLVLGLIHLLANGIDERPNAYVVGRTVALAALVAVTYFSLQFAAEWLLAGSVPATQRLRGPIDLAILLYTIVAFSSVTFFQSVVPRQAKRPRWQALYAHLSNGLYVNTLANRWLLKFWPTQSRARPASPP
jgi:NAD(P)H-quinone oxidoreductase subunit 5